MKKTILFILFLLVFVVTNAFPQSQFKKSAGIGLYATGDFGSGIYLKGKKEYDDESYKSPYFGGGFFAFFDMTFFEVNLGLFGAGGKWYSLFEGDERRWNEYLIGLDIGLSLKYPFIINDKINIFPLVNLNYKPMFIWLYDYGYFDKLFLKFGTGFDYSLSENKYFRMNVLYGLGLMSITDIIDYYYYKKYPFLSRTYNYIRGHGFDVKLALGFKL